MTKNSIFDRLMSEYCNPELKEIAAALMFSDEHVSYSTLKFALDLAITDDRALPRDVELSIMRHVLDCVNSGNYTATKIVLCVYATLVKYDIKFLVENINKIQETLNAIKITIDTTMTSDSNIRTLTLIRKTITDIQPTNMCELGHINDLLCFTSVFERYGIISDLYALTTEEVYRSCGFNDDKYADELSSVKLSRDKITDSKVRASFTSCDLFSAKVHNMLNKTNSLFVDKINIALLESYRRNYNCDRIDIFHLNVLYDGNTEIVKRELFSLLGSITNKRKYFNKNYGDFVFENSLDSVCTISEMDYYFNRLNDLNKCKRFGLFELFCIHTDTTETLVNGNYGELRKIYKRMNKSLSLNNKLRVKLLYVLCVDGNIYRLMYNLLMDRKYVQYIFKFTKLTYAEAVSTNRLFNILKNLSCYPLTMVDTIPNESMFIGSKLVRDLYNERPDMVFMGDINDKECLLSILAYGGTTSNEPKEEI